MATIRIPERNESLSEKERMRTFLAPFGIQYDSWPVSGRIGAEATSEEILRAYDPEIQELNARGGYITADVIDVTPDLPGLQAMLDRFNKEHTHAEDEVRFIVKGRGIFFIHPSAAPVFSVEVEEGDLINVPAGTKHWFDLCSDRTIRAIRLFREKAGWTPNYTEDPIAAAYEPLCFGPRYLRADLPSIAPGVQVA
ncbi:MAG: cupin domain-containing protein [Chthoniobacteraceae bacterium]